MKALTLHQPWATAIAVGLKTIETRSWCTDYCGPLAIHAGKERKYINPSSKYFVMNRYPFVLIDIWERFISSTPFPLGCIVATCNLVECIKIKSVPNDLTSWWPESVVERYLGNYSIGRYAWILENIRELPEPIPARGAQGLWEWRR